MELSTEYVILSEDIVGTIGFGNYTTKANGPSVFLQGTPVIGLQSNPSNDVILAEIWRPHTVETEDV